MDPASDYAVLSKLAYNIGSNGSSDVRGIQQELRRHGLSKKYGVSDDLNSTDHVTFYTKGKGDRRGIVAYRGTELDNRSDLLADAAIFMGVERMTPRFSRALGAAREAMDRYGDVHVTGHSLGGTQAMHVTKELGVESHVYNPGRGFRRFSLIDRLGPLRTFFGRENKMNEDNANVYLTGVDPISIASWKLPAKTHFRTPKSWDVHGIDNFVKTPEKKRRQSHKHEQRKMGRHRHDPEKHTKQHKVHNEGL